jgi:hypothetical protein
MENQTLEQIANECFDELGYVEGDDTFIDKNAHMPLTPEQSLADASQGEQDKSKEAPAKVEKPTEERLYAGEFKTPEEMEKAFIESKKVNTAPPPPPPVKKEEELPDLNNEELTTLSEQDDQDSTTWVSEYLKKKMATRNLTDFELGKLKELDDGKMDLYGEYIALKTERDILGKLEPVLGPVKQEQAEKNFLAYNENEKAVEESNSVEFGKEELATLKKTVSDPQNIDKVLAQSPMKSIIEHEWQHGSKAMSHKLLLRETKLYLAKEQANINAGKKEKSIPADLGGKPAHVKVEKSSSVEQAFEDSCKEFNF